MAAPGAIRAGKAFVEIGGDNNPLVKALRASEGMVKAWSKRIAAIGGGLKSAGLAMMAGATAVLAPMALAVRHFMSAGDELDKMSARVGASVEFLSALSHAAKIGGTDIAAMEVSIRRLQRTAYDAAEGSSMAATAFRQLGVSIRGPAGQLKSTEELFMDVAGALSNLRNDTQKAALAMIVFGRAGTSLLPMLSQGKQGLIALMEEAERLGLTMSTEDAQAAAALTDAWTRLWSTLKKVAFHVGSALAPALRELSENMAEGVSRIAAWVRQHRELIVLVAKLAGGLFAAGLALRLLGTAMVALAPVVALVGTGIGLIGSALAALLTPIGLVLTGLAALASYFAWSTGAAGKAVQWLGRVLGTLQEDAAIAFQGIRDALAAGDINLAAQVLWAALKLEWARGIGALETLWRGVTDWFADAWAVVVSAVIKTAASAWTLLHKAWVEVVKLLIKAWELFKWAVFSGWYAAVEWSAKRIIDLQRLARQLTPEEAAEAKRQIDIDAERRKTRLSTEYTAAITAAEEAAAGKLKDIEDWKVEVVQGAEGDKQLAIQQRQQAATTAEKQLADELKRKQDQLKALSGQAAAARKRAEEAAPELGRPPGPGPGVDLEGLAGARAMAFGTFSPFAAAMLGGGPIRQMAADIRQIRENTKAMRELKAFARWGP